MNDQLPRRSQITFAATKEVSTDAAATKPYTAAGVSYLKALTQWLQDTRLFSEACYRLSASYQRDQKVDFSDDSWPKFSKKGRASSTPVPIGSPSPSEATGASTPPGKPFEMSAAVIKDRTNVLLKTLWAERFVLLETLWEEYLQNLAKDLRHKDSTLFEPFVEKDFMAGIVREVITDQLTSIEAIKDEVATRFAAGITRQSWKEQWKQLQRLGIGLSTKDPEKDPDLYWWVQLDIYFEMRNCIIHRKGRVSPLLRTKQSSHFSKLETKFVDVRPQELDWYRHQFIACLLHLEERLAAKFESPSNKSKKGV